MPQKSAKLPDATIADIARWIDLGPPTTGRSSTALALARPVQPTHTDKDFWSFRPLTPRPASPGERSRLDAHADRPVYPGRAGESRPNPIRSRTDTP